MAASYISKLLAFGRRMVALDRLEASPRSMPMNVYSLVRVAQYRRIEIVRDEPGQLSLGFKKNADHRFCLFAIRSTTKTSTAHINASAAENSATITRKLKE